PRYGPFYSPKCSSSFYNAPKYLFIKAHNETNPKGNCAEKPCVTGALAKRKSTIVSDTFVSKLSCLFGGADGSRTRVRKESG
ncbi:hypothetical protein MR578_05350, partial [bacterium]|nr:hypothetical protein [bacterium]